MDRRTIGEIIADLREYDDGAADRLTELNAEMATMHRTVVHECCERVVMIDALRPDCPTCGGKRIVRNLTTYEVVVHDPCPDCVDGKVSIEQLAATWREASSADGVVVVGLRFGTPDAITLLANLRVVRP